MPNPLDPQTLIRSLPTLLPRSSGSPLLHPTDALAALVHAIHVALDFRLVNPSATANPAISAPSQGAGAAQTQNDASASGEKEIDDTASETETAVDQEEDLTSVENQLPNGWNDRGEDSYSFQYRHAQSSMVFRIRVGRMGTRVQLDAMAEVSPVPLCFDQRTLGVMLAEGERHVGRCASHYLRPH